MNPYLRSALIAAVFLFSVGLMDGVTDTMQFHYSKSVFAKWSQDAPTGFWSDPRTGGWTRKYKRDVEGNLIRPLQPAFFGSTTFLVFVTDAWHLAKEIKMALWRTLCVLLAASIFASVRWYYWVGVWLAAWLVQAAGFHLFYSWLLV